MHRLIGAALAVAFSFALSGAADAKQCRDAHGKFMKCPPAMMTAAPKKPCRDAKGKFIKCKTM